VKVRIVLVVLVGALVSCTKNSAEREPGGPETGTPLAALFGRTLIDGAGKQVSVDTLAGKKIGIYFSAHWCPPCKVFTPKLVAFHREVTAAGKPFEIVFVSGDHNEAAMKAYMREVNMPWLAVPFGNPRVQKLAQRFSVSGIPRLVVLSAEGAVLKSDARMDVDQKGAAAYDVW
jgi:nucleoredoxin